MEAFAVPSGFTDAFWPTGYFAAGSPFAVSADGTRLFSAHYAKNATSGAYAAVIAVNDTGSGATVAAPVLLANLTYPVSVVANGSFAYVAFGACDAKGNCLPNLEKVDAAGKTSLFAALPVPRGFTTAFWQDGTSATGASFAISPDGSKLYATYYVTSKTVPYATAVVVLDAVTGAIISGPVVFDALTYPVSVVATAAGAYVAFGACNSQNQCVPKLEKIDGSGTTSPFAAFAVPSGFTSAAWPNGASTGGNAFAVSPDGSRLYATYYANGANGLYADVIATYDTTTAQLVAPPAVLDALTYPVSVIAAASGAYAAFGACDATGLCPPKLMKVDASGTTSAFASFGVPDGFNFAFWPNASSSTGDALALSRDGTRLYVTFYANATSGQFASVVAVLDAATGAAVAAPTMLGSNYPVALAASPWLMPETGWWWDPHLSGTGFFIEYGGNSANGMFIGGFLYDAAENNTWLVSTGPFTQPTSTYTSQWLRASGGQTLLGSYKAPRTAAVATLAIAFSDSTHAVMTRPDGSQVNVQRFSFSPTATPDPPVAGAPQTGWWWGGSSLSGTGFGIEVQGSNVFIVAYVYDGAGNPVWYLATGGLTSPTSYSGAWDVYTGGPQLTSPEGNYSAHKVDGASVPMSLTFADSTHGTLAMGDVTIPVVRFQEF